MRRIPLVLGTFLMVLACGGGPNLEVIEAYKTARKEALVMPGPAPERWAPDAVLQLSGDTVQRLVDAGLASVPPIDATLDNKAIELKPKLVLQDVKLASSSVCDACFATELVVKGPVRYDAGLLGKGKLNTVVRANADLELKVGAAESGFPVTVVLRKAKKIRVEIDGVPKMVSDLVEPLLTKSFDAFVLDRIKAFEVLRPGSDALPLRAVAVRPVGTGVALDMLTQAGSDASVEAPPVEGDWSLDLAADSLIALVARESFKAGPQELGLVGQPTSIRMKKQGTFELGLRLWRTEGDGWWRDLMVTGQSNIGPRKVQLTAKDAEVVAQSKGAAFADPLVWLAESILLEQLSDAVEVALPAVENTKLGPLEAKATLKGLKGGKGRLRTFGDVSISK